LKGEKLTPGDHSISVRASQRRWIPLFVTDNQKVKMKFDRIDAGEGESYLAFNMGEIEYANPLDFFEEYYLKSKAILFTDIIEREAYTQNIKLEQGDTIKFAYKKANEWWQDHLLKINQIQIPTQIKLLLNTTKKKEQQKLLKNFHFTAFDLLAFVFYAYQNEGYTFSQYEGEHDPIGTEPEKKPAFIHLDGDKVNKAGKTEYTDGQLKQIVKQRKKTIGKILDRGDEWHCFFVTYGSLRGDEKWKEGQPHFHYISDKFGLTREHVVTQLKSRKYNLGNLPHIEFNDDFEEE